MTTTGADRQLPMRRAVPMIGLTAGYVAARWGPWSGPAVLVAGGYVSAVERAGAGAIVLPAVGSVIERPELVLSSIDALIVTGGCDVDPQTYGVQAQPETGPVDRSRDRFEVALVRAAFACDLPVLATCRGMQVMNVAFGGTLQQHLDGRAGQTHRRREGEYARHPVHLTPGSLAARATGERRPEVDSHHHQAVDVVAPNFRVTGRADDGLIEAIEDPSRGFALGVQWHPEDDRHSRLIHSLVVDAQSRPVTRE